MRDLGSRKKTITHLDLDCVHALGLGYVDAALDDAAIAVHGQRDILLLGDEAQADTAALGLFRDFSRRTRLQTVERESLLERLWLRRVRRSPGKR